MFATSSAATRFQSSACVTARHLHSGDCKRAAPHDVPPPLGSPQRLIRAFTRADSAQSPSIASRFSLATGARSVHACGNVTVMPSPAVQMKTSCPERRTVRHTRTRRPDHGWNG
ncbi:hypothetical protein [Streptomyces sp. A5-4]|uniref:hypothetical protein n=1 Tax=Streptomyces sp. A5-4 TaxID=3384771 RepID=UPI003DA90FE2